ncbi:MAG TPA: PKD domain-containing protein, partial [Gemmataceae bacterium]|nr:PKD domain-containing protein [Gemmataceae bacterium]
YPVSVSVTDDDGGSTTAGTSVTVNNVAPSAVVLNSGTINENDTFTLTGSFADPGTQDTHQVVISWGPGEGSTTLNLAAGVLNFTASHQYLDDNPTGTPSDSIGIGVTVTDDDTGSATASTSVTVNNLAPVVAPIVAPTDPVAAGSPSPVAVSSSFTDVGTLDTHTAVWDWGDGTASPGTVTESGGSGTVAGTHTYMAAGVYTVKLTVTDDDTGATPVTSGFVVVFDPSAGFVTGGGWIDSPAGAYTPDPTLTGKASFGFVSQYHVGTSIPDGNTQFRFHATDFDFKSTNYEWMVIAGPKAQYKGTGTVNGTGTYKFLLTATDGQRPGGGGVDKFRIKIWNAATGVVVYDNQMGASDTSDPATALAGGSIQIHDNSH